MLKRDPFQWTIHAKEGFQILKKELITTHILALLDFTKPFTLETNASRTGVGAVLSQNNHPITYFLKKLSPRIQRQSTYTKELYTITEA